MRQDVVEYLQTQNLGSYIVSTELPYSETAVPLYLKNLKKVYIDVDEYIVEPVVITLSGVNVSNETTVVRVYLANDAKTIPGNYEEVVSIIKGAKNINPEMGFNRREVDVNTSFDADRLVTEIELRYIKLI